MVNQDPTQLLYDLREEVDSYIQNLIQQKLSHQQEILFYSLGWLDKCLRPLKIYSGKRIRPALCLLTYQAINGYRDNAIPLAASIELFHTFTLVHDDIMDRDEERRGVPTVWKIWGDAIALTAGDSLISLAFVNLRNIQSASNRALAEIYAGLADVGICLGTGQHLDIVFESDQTVTPNMYMEMISGKTVALIEFATYSAALLATNDQTTINHMRNFGKNLGYAFQIRDDYLNIWGESYKSQKTAYGDLIRKKKTLPIIYAFDHASSRAKQIITQIYADPQKQMTEDEQKSILNILNDLNTKEYVSDKINQYIYNAHFSLNAANIKDGLTKVQLVSLTEYLLKREM